MRILAYAFLMQFLLFRARRTPSSSQRISLFRRMGYAGLWLWSFVCLFPIFWLAITSLKSEDDITSGPHYLPFVDFWPTLRAWSFLLTDPGDNLVSRYANSIVIGLSSTLLTLLLGAMLVYALKRFQLRFRLFGNRLVLGNHALLFMLLATRILPPVVILLPVYMMAQVSGLLDTHLALIIAYTASNLPIAIWLMLPLFGTVATEQEEAAQLDGASHATILFSVLLPMIAGSLVAIGLLIFLQCWNEYLYATYLVSDHALTLPPFLVGQMSMKEAQIGSEAEEWANFSAASLLMILPILAATGFAQRAVARFALR
jgi:multiple sugar transport system permease protein